MPISVACPAGTYNPTEGGAICQVCPEGTVPNLKQDDCDKCAAVSGISLLALVIYHIHQVWSYYFITFKLYVPNVIFNLLLPNYTARLWLDMLQTGVRGSGRGFLPSSTKHLLIYKTLSVKRFRVITLPLGVRKARVLFGKLVFGKI